ncbi:MAG: helix-turn-helix domain-containing protein, partial [Candidatus Aminicenantes bacterium]|nr:helix-turn-helix domain-containing protein [Candidatus Aminicenantes bacterium]
LKKDIATSHIPIILLTARASEKEVILGLEAGADDYITKPFNVEILLTRIKNLIGLRRLLQEKIAQRMLLQPREISVSSLDNKFVKELQDIIEKHLSDPGFNVEQLAQKLYMSPSTLRRKIAALTGETTNELIRSYRLTRAAQLLKAKFGNVTEVAFAVGFSDASYFARCFKEKFNRSPHNYTGD